MPGRLQNVAANIAVLSMCVAPAAFAGVLDDDRTPAIVRYEPAPWLSLEVRASLLDTRFDHGDYIPGAAERTATAAATMRVPNGWTASLLVNYLGKRRSAETDGAFLKSSTFVNGRLARNLSKKTRVTFDVFNVFNQRVRDVDYFSTARLWNQPAAADSFFFNPAEARGFRLKLRTAF